MDLYGTYSNTLLYQYNPNTQKIAMCFGCIGEAVGYGGRIMMYNDVFDENAFTIQICCLIISPAFISAGIYLTLKHIVISFGESWSRLKPVCSRSSSRGPAVASRLPQTPVPACRTSAQT
jgi:hypothetical protein